MAKNKKKNNSENENIMPEQEPTSEVTEEHVAEPAVEEPTLEEPVAEAAPTEPVPTEKKSKKLPIIIALIAVFIAALAAIIAFALPRSDGEPDGDETYDEDTKVYDETSFGDTTEGDTSEGHTPETDMDDGDNEGTAPTAKPAVPKPTAYELADSSYFYEKKNGKLTVYRNGDLVGTLDVETPTMIATAPNGAAVMTDGVSLTYIGAEYFHTIANIDAAGLLKLANDGKTTIYTDTNGDLILLDAAGGSILSAIEGPITDAVISPNGSAILYSMTSDAELYIYANDTSTKLGGNLAPVAITDNGELAWAVDGDTVYRIADGKQEAVCEDFDSLTFNADNTQLVCLADGNYYLAGESGELVLLFPNEGTDTLTPLMPKYADTSIVSFTDRVYYNGDNYYYLLSDLTVTKLTTDDITMAELSMDGAALYYVADGRLVKLDIASGNEEVLIEEGVSSFTLTTDDNFYYTDKIMDLYLFGNNEAICGSVEHYEVSPDGIVLIMSDYSEKKGTGDLFIIEIIDEMELLSDKGADLGTGAHLAYYSTDDDVFVSGGDGAFAVISKDYKNYSTDIVEIMTREEPDDGGFDIPFIPFI